MARKLRGPDGLKRYVADAPVRFAMRAGAIVVQPFKLDPSQWGDRKAYATPIMPIDPPQSILRFEDGRESLQISSLAELAALLDRRGIRLAEEAVGRELPLAEWLLAYTHAGLPYWTYRFGLYPPGEFEARYGLPRDGGRPLVVETDLVFWTWSSAFERQHLKGMNEIRWNLTSLIWHSRQLSAKP